MKTLLLTRGVHWRHCCQPPGPAGRQQQARGSRSAAARGKGVNKLAREKGNKRGGGSPRQGSGC